MIHSFDKINAILPVSGSDIVSGRYFFGTKELCRIQKSTKFYGFVAEYAGVGSLSICIGIKEIIDNGSVKLLA